MGSNSFEKGYYGTEDRDRPETKKSKFVEDVWRRAPIGKEGERVKRLSVFESSEGQRSKVNLSPSEVLARNGWDSEVVKAAKVGSLLHNLAGQNYEVIAVSGSKLTMRNLEDQQDVGEINRGLSRQTEARKYSYKVGGREGKGRSIVVHDFVYFKEGGSSLETSDFINDIVRAIPAQFAECIDEIRIDRESQSAAAVSRMETSLLSHEKRNIVTLHVDPDNYNLAEALDNLYHELGHAVIRKMKKNAHPGPKWVLAMAGDGNQISEYSAKKKYKDHKPQDNGEIEDVAEAFRLYCASDADPKVRAEAEGRFRVIEDIGRYLERRRNWIDMIRKTEKDKPI